ncbi:MAG: hypothetical protein V4819_08080 [Verrucomicrobiota bacterium]
MPADFFIDSQRGIVFSKAAGVFGHAEALDHMDRLQSDQDFHPEFNQLFDFREVTTITLSCAEVERLAQRDIFSARSGRAFVVFGDLGFGLGRVFETYRELQGETGIAIFRNMQEALSWLSLPAEPEPGLFSKLQASPTDA